MTRQPAEEQRPFDPRKISASRVNSLLSCGVAFKMKYLDKVPEETSGSAALFGSVVHKALEDWGPNREQDLLALMRQAWLHVTEGTTVRDFIGEYAPLSGRAIRLEHQIRTRRPEIKVVRMTKDWKTDPICAEIEELVSSWLPRLEAGSFWRFSERDPLPTLYDESLVLARRYEARWRHLPPALHTEFAFDLPWRGFRLTGYIDAIENAMDRDTGEQFGYLIGDYKTYRNEPPPQKDYRQKVMYDVAVRELVAAGVLQLPNPDLPLLVCMDYVRWTDAWKTTKAREVAQMGPEDHDRLERELNAYLGIVERGDFLPAEKGRNPDFCGYPGQCCLRNCAAAGGAVTKVEVNL